jgi:hypothetical protein
VQEVIGDGAAVEVRPVAVEAPAATALLEAAADAELLVVGSRGPRRLRSHYALVQFDIRGDADEAKNTV